MTLEARDRAAALLAEAEAAHGRYEARELGGVFDEEWPAWYASFLLARGFGDLVPRAPGADDLAARLAACAAAHEREAPDEPWTSFYARRLVDPDDVGNSGDSGSAGGGP